VDSVCLDLEDAVAPQQKQQARANIAKALDALAFQPATEVLVRVNAWDTGLVEEDVRGVLAASKRPHGFVIPKVGSLSELASFHKLLQRSGVGELPVIGMVENAKGVLAVGEIARARELAAGERAKGGGGRGGVWRR
jgi:citrate lyase beta subunit